jgi:hypothetical protein
MRRLALLTAAAVLVLPSGRSSDRLLPLHQAPAATSSLTGILYEPGGLYRLAQVDPATLGVGRTSDGIPQGYGWARSPDGAQLALGTGVRGSYETTALQLVDSTTLALVGKPVVFSGIVRAAVWPASGALYAVVETMGRSSLQTVDPATRKIVAQRQIGGQFLSHARFDRGLVLLLGVDGKIAPARLAVVYPDGLARTVRIPRIDAGSVWRHYANGIGETRTPGLAVDDAGRVAYVIDAGWRIAAVDLRTLKVTYHRPVRALLARFGSWLTPAAEAKGMNGPVRMAQWLGDGLIAVWGSNQTAVRKKGVTEYAGSPAGVWVLDTRSWSVRMIDAQGNAAVVGEGFLLTTGGRWSSTGANSSRGVAAFGPDGALRWVLDERSNNWISTVYGSLVVLGKQSNLHDVVDAQSGKLIRSDVAAPVPTLLLGQGS